MSNQVAAIMAGLDKFSAEKITRLGSEIVANLQEDTPVDIGWARANWVAAIGEPYITDPITKPGASDVSVQLGRASAGVASLATYKIADGPVFISNNVPYIRRLDEGWSDQAPSGFVQAAITRAVRRVS